MVIYVHPIYNTNQFVLQELRKACGAGFTYKYLEGNTSAGSYDLFVVKYNSSGTKKWTQQLGSSSRDHARGVATDSSGNVYVTGDTYGGVDGNTNAGYNDLFVVKYNSSGTKQWTKQFGSSMRY